MTYPTHILETTKTSQELIQKEIEWCKSHLGESNKGCKFEDGFVAGLEQAIYLIRQLEEQLGCRHENIEPTIYGPWCKDCLEFVVLK